MGSSSIVEHLTNANHFSYKNDRFAVVIIFSIVLYNEISKCEYLLWGVDICYIHVFRIVNRYRVRFCNTECSIVINLIHFK